MKAKEAEAKEKEKLEKMKALRRELEAELEEQLSRAEENRDPKVEVHEESSAVEMTPDRARQVIEAVLFAASKPMTIAELRRVARGFTPKQIEGLINELRESYQANGRSFEILEIAGGYEMSTRKEFAPWIMKVELAKKVRQATQSALETLAILAYKQPITRAEIEGYRGVDVSGVMNTLSERGFIKIVGKKEVPGRPFLYGTTEKFLEHFGLKSLEALPSIDEIRTIVEQSVRKEELLGKSQIVDVPQENAEAEAAAEAESAEGAVAEETAEEETREAPEESGEAAPEASSEDFTESGETENQDAETAMEAEEDLGSESTEKKD